MSDAKRQQLKAKVAKGEARLRERQSWAERAVAARDTALDLARDHPVLVVAGGLALGFLVSTLFKRSPTRRVAEQGSRKAGRMAWMAAELALPFVQQALAGATEAGRAGRDRLEDFGETAGDRAGQFGRKAVGRAGETLDAAQDLARGAGRRIAKAVRH